ncbi:hypothetical protein L208DRAFT_752676 [Tricholoma matsutake]|nr:hypothetical protein L208DRAFT_752676 [Tricholoma matsutake 945]
MKHKTSVALWGTFWTTIVVTPDSCSPSSLNLANVIVARWRRKKSQRQKSSPPIFDCYHKQINVRRKKTVNPVAKYHPPAIIHLPMNGPHRLVSCCHGLA